MVSEVACVLQSARKLIEDPDRWIKGGFAKTSKLHGEWTNVWDKDATCFCLVGALNRQHLEYSLMAVYSAKFVLEGFLFKLHPMMTSLEEFKDSSYTRHRDVI